MKDNKRLVPRRRFRQFLNDGAWEERRLGDFGSVAMNKRIFKEQTTEIGDVPFFKIGTFGGEPDAYIPYELFKEYKDKYAYPEVGDILISASGSIGRTLEYTGENQYFQDSNIVWLKHNGRLDNPFLKQLYGIIEWQGLEGSTIKRLYNKNIMETRIHVPALAEQNKVGEFFGELDKLITLQQRKLEKAKNLKSAYNYKMFPREGEKYPELRFAGFTDAWEQRKLSELANFTKGRGYTKSDLRESGSPIILYGRLYTNYETMIEEVNTFAEVKENSVISFGGEVIVPSSGESAEDIARAAVVGKPGIILGGDLNVIKPVEQIEPVFLALAISHGTPNRDMVKRAQGKSVVHLHNTDLKNINLVFPRIEEQIKIAELNLGIDNLITLHQRKLDKLKDIKQAYLNEMFV